MEADSAVLLSKSDFKTTNVFKSIEPFVDMGNLLIEDLEPFDLDQYKAQGDQYLNSLTRDNVQYMFNKIWELPTERLEDAIVVKLPDAISRIPREKPIPKMRDATRWERYANLKGITNTKKSRMLWSEETQNWQPRWGYKRAKDNTKDWVVEIPHQSDPYKDYIGERIEKKKERVAKNELQRLKNIHNESAKSQEFPGMQPEQKSSEQLARQVNRATTATASIGKFTPKFKEERPPKNAGKKRKFLPNENTVTSEKDRQIDILNRLQSKTAPLNINVAAGKFTQDEQTRAHESNLTGETSFDYKKHKPKSRGAVKKRSRDQKGGRNSRKPQQGGRKPQRGGRKPQQGGKRNRKGGGKGKK